MIREDKFVMSRRQYAVDLTSLTRLGGKWEINALWFRRRRGVTVACSGTLWDFPDAAPADAVAFLAGREDGRYGGHCLARWDGAGYWGAEDPVVAAAELAVLRPMLAAYPVIPPGHDGWWRFQTDTERFGGDA